MKRARIAVLLAALALAALAYYFHHFNRVRVETVIIESKHVGKRLPYKVVLPPGYDLFTERKTRYPVLYLLHGWGGSHESWLAHTSLASYAAQYRLIIVTPEGDNGWYTDSATVRGEEFETYFFAELIPNVQSQFRTIERREGRGVAGNSMGGYGALKFGLKHPGQFAFAGSTGGAFDAPARTDDPSIMRAFGPADSPTRAANDLARLARDFPQENKALLPYLYLDCGTRDPWLAHNRALAEQLLARGFTHEFRQLPGEHIWPYWDKQLGEILRLSSELLTQPQETSER